MKAPSPIAIIRSVLGPDQADALLRGGVAPASLARALLEAAAPTNLPATLAAAGLEKAEPLSARTVLAVQNLIRLNQMRADRAIREAALGKAEGLEKRSKNVREKTTNITPEQAEGRRVRYAQSLGLEPTKTQGEGMPKPSRNKLLYGGNFPVEHEVAHAMMTPGSKTIRQYTDSLSSRARAGKKAIADQAGDKPGYRIPHNFNDLYHDYHDAEQEENTARMLEHHIDRRSGVNPSRPELQASAQIAAGAPMHSFRRIDVPEEHPFNNYWDYSDEELEAEPSRGSRFKPKDKKQLEQEARSGARSEIQRWDAGSKFRSGKVVPPSGLDARINARAAGGGFRKSERAPKLPPDQHGIGPKHEPEDKITPTKQLEPQVHQNRGAKRQPATLEGILKSEIGRPVDVKTAKPEKVKKECPVYQHIRDAYQAENWSKARDLELRTEGNSTWIMHNGKGLKLIPGIGGGREKARAYIEAARQKALKETINKSDAAEWRSRPVLRAEDAQDLDHAAAARSLSSGSAQEGERQAYEEYSRQQRLDAMAHHFRQAGEAQKRGDRPTSDRHMLAYAGHARALGIDPAGHPPPEVGERIRQLAGKKSAFRGHPADRLA